MSVPGPCVVSAAALIQLYNCTGDWIWLTAEDASPCADTKRGGQTGEMGEGKICPLQKYFRVQLD